MNSATTREHKVRSRPWRWLLAAVITLAAALAGYSVTEYRRIGTQERVRLEDTARIVETGVGRQIAAVNRALDGIREAYPDWQRTKGGINESVQYLKAMQGAMPGVRSFVVLDASGTIITINRPDFIGKNFQTRDYFQAVLRAPESATLYLTPPFKSASNIWTMALSRPLAGPGEAFAGVIAGTLEQTEFQHLLGAVRYAPDLQIALYQDSGNRFVSVPENANLTATEADADVLGIERRLEIADIKLSTPLTLRLRRDRSAVFAEWQQQTWLLSGLLLAATLVSSLFLRTWQRRKETEARLIADYEAKRRAQQEALERSETYNRLVVSALNVGAVDIDLDNGQAQCDDAWMTLLGFAREGFLLTLDSWQWLVHPDDASAARDLIAALREQESTTPIELRLRDSRDGWRWFTIYGRQVAQAHSDTHRLLLVHVDIAAKKAEEAILRRNEERIRSLLVSIQEMVLFIDTASIIREYHQPEGQVPYFDNNAALVGQEFAAVLPPVVAEPLSEGIVAIMMSQSAPEFGYELECNGEARSYHCVVSEVQGQRKGFPLGFLVVVRDVTEFKAAEAKILNLALYDALTDLPNRRLLDDRLRQALAVSARDGHYGALMFLDLDRFKALNDNHGHDAGDALLREVSARLQASVRASDTVARLGGDEFVVMLETLHTDAGEARTLAAVSAEKIRLALCAPYVLQTGTGTLNWECSSSIGVSLFKGHSANADELFKRADQAMYVAKKAGRNQVAFSAPP